MMGVGMMHTTNQRIILRRIQERKSFTMNQATPHLGAKSSLINSESSNRHGQPRLGTALTTGWMASTRMSQYMGRTDKALECKQRHPVMMEHRRGGTYISNQVRMHACQLTLKHCTYFLFCCRKNPQCSLARLGTKKKREKKKRKKRESLS
jgi:hypothetical protein